MNIYRAPGAMAKMQTDDGRTTGMCGAHTDDIDYTAAAPQASAIAINA